MIKLWKIFGVELHPIGDVVINTTGINPGNRYKGTWELISIGQMLIGVDPNDPVINIGKKTGGSKNPLTKHSHTIGGFPNGNPSTWADPHVRIVYQTTNTNPYPTTQALINQSGDNTDHNNYPPFCAVYIWERVA